MANWDDVRATALTLPEVTVGQAREGASAYDVAGRQFARLRHSSLWAWLDRLDPRELRELLVGSW